VNKQADTIDFLLTAKREKNAALRFLTRAIDRSGKPGLINIDKSGTNTAAIHTCNHDHCKRIKIRQYKYLNNIVEQDHRPFKGKCHPMLGFKSFHPAQKTLAGIDLMSMIKKEQMRVKRGDQLTPAEQFHALATQSIKAGDRLFGFATERGLTHINSRRHAVL